MKKILYRIFSVFLVIVLLVSSISSTFATGPVAEYVAGTFFDVIAGQLVSEGIDYIKDFIGYSAGKECESSSDGYHHCEKAAFGHGTGGTDEDGRYSLVSCKYCGETFKFYSSGGFGPGGSGFGKSDLQQSYEAQVEELPASVYGADGSIYVIPNLTVFHKDESSYCWTMSNGETKENSVYRISVSLPLIRYEILQNLYEKQETCRYGVELTYIIPFLCSVEVLYSSATCKSFLTESILTLNSSVTQNCTAGSEFSVEFCSDYLTMIKSDNGRYVLQGNYVNFYLHDLRLKLTPYDIGTTVGDTYSTTSRPTSITGDYGIIGDNGQIVKVEGDKIVNETNNNYYNPATGETTTITDWSYNYEDRSYTVTTESGDTVTITYGDENVTIQEGDIIYNVYYLVDGSGSEGPGPDVPPACNHQWTETSTTPATCTVPGSRSLTCSLCNETKTETIPAPGHKWVIRQEVKNEYDENGNQTQEGYTIWECSVCGEQQKTTDGTAPPGGGSGTGSGSSGGVFSGIFGLLVDFLGFFWNTFRDFVGEGVKGFLNALMDGTSSIFGLLNPFNWGG